MPITPPRAPRRAYFLALAALALPALPTPARADAAAWLGGSGEWTSPSNWSTNTAPNAPDALAFFQAAGTNPLINLAANTTLGTFLFDAPATSYRLASTNASTLTFTSTTGTASLLVTAAAGASATSLTLATALASNLTLTNNAAGNLLLSGPLSGTGNLLLSGTGPVTLTGNNSNWSPAAITVAQGTLSTVGGSNNSLGSPTAGTITVAPGASLDISGITAPNTSNIFTKTLLLSGNGSAASAGALAFGGTANTLLGPVALINGATLFAKSATALLNLGDPSGITPLGAAPSLSGTGPLIKTGLGTLQLNIPSTHTGGTLVNAGTLTINPSGSLVNTGTTTVNPGGKLTLKSPAGNTAANSVSPNSILLNGGTLGIAADINLNNLLAPTSTSGVISLDTPGTFTSGGTNLVDLSALPAAAVIRLGATGTATLLPAALTLLPDPLTHTLHFGGLLGTLTLASPLADVNGAPTNVDFSTGNQTLLLTGTSSYTGTTSVNGAVTLLVNAPNALGATTGTAFLNAGTLTINAPVTHAFVQNAGTFLVNNTVSGTIAIKGGIATFTQPGTAAITLAGGTLTLNTFWSQPISQTGGTLSLPVAITAPLLVSGGTVNFTASAATPMTLSGGAVLINATSSGLITLNPGSLVRQGSLGNFAPQTVLLAGGTLSLTTNLPLTPWLNPASTGGVISLDAALAFTNGTSNTYDFSALPGGPALALSTTSNATLGAAVTLRPDDTTHTLRLGAPGATGTLTLARGITDFNATPTNLSIAQGFNVTLATASTYTGTTTINGLVTLNNPLALGAGSGTDADGTTVNPGAKLTTAGTVTLANEKITANGGTLALSTTGPVVINGSTNIAGTFAGPISGPGDIFVTANLLLTGINDHSGSIFINVNGNVTANSSTALGSIASATTINTGGTLTITAASPEPVIVAGGDFNVKGPYIGPATVNSGIMTVDSPYAGTSIVSGGSLTINAASSGSISLTSGTVTINKAGSNPIAVQGGMLNLFDITNPYTGPLTLANGVIAFQANGFTRITSPLFVAGNSTLFTGSANLSSSQIGGLTGSGTLSFGPGSLNSGVGTLNISGPTAFSGQLIEYGPTLLSDTTTSGLFVINGTVNSSGNFQHTGTIHLRGGNLAINGPSAQVDEIRNENSTLTVNTSASVNRLIIYGNLSASLAGSGTLSLPSNRFDYYAGILNFSGQIPGLTQITKTSPGIARIAQFPSLFGGALNVIQGELQLQNTIGPSTVPINVGSAATLNILGGTFSNPITINSPDRLAEIVFSGATGITGSVDLGTQGAAFSALSPATGYNLSFTGTLSGGAWSVGNGLTVSLLSSGHSYSGATRIDGNLQLREAGALPSNTSLTLNLGGTLILDNQSSRNEDRVSDNAPVKMRGAWIELDGFASPTLSTTETISLTAEAGLNTVVAKKTQGGGSNNFTRLNLLPLSRSPGAVISFAGVGTFAGLGASPSDPQVTIAGQAPVSFLGGAFVYDAQNFVKYGADGVARLDDGDLSAAPESAWTDQTIPYLDSNIALTASRTILAMKMTAPLNLGSNTLNVVSGGLILIPGSQITGTPGNRLTAGGTAPAAELFFHSGTNQFSPRNIAANITDNPGPDGLYDPTPGGPLDADNGIVSAVFSNTAQYVLSGRNTYSGTTYINGAKVAVNTADAVSPGPIVINGGSYVVNGTFTALTGTITLNQGSIAGPGNINAATYVIAQGTLSAPLVGSGPLSKFTSGAASIDDVANFTGPISISGGSVSLSSSSPFISNQISVQNASLRVVGNNLTLSGPVTLGDNAILYPGFGFTWKPSSLAVGSNATIYNEAQMNVPGPGDPFTDTFNSSLHLNVFNAGNMNFGPGIFNMNTFSGGNIGVPTATSVIVDNAQLTTISVSGLLKLRPGAGEAPSVIGTLTLAGAADAWTGTVDISDRTLLIHPSDNNKATALTRLANQVASGRHGGDWLGTGITSSTVAADPLHKTLVLVDSQNLTTAILGGGVLDENHLLLTATWFGDSNLDRQVNVTDLGVLATYYGQNTGAFGPIHGDFNNDGVVNVTDLGLLATNYGQGTTGQPFSLEADLGAFPMLTSAVPEPTSAATLMLAAPLLLRRRKK